MIKKYPIFVLFIMLFFFAMAGVVLAEDLGAICESIAASANGCPGLDATSCKAQLQKCADYYDQQSSQIADDITKTSQQKKTLSGAISNLKSKINNLNAQISKSTVMVKDLNIQISDTQLSINKTSEQIDDSRTQLKNILRAIRQEDTKPSFAILLEGDLSDFFSNITYLEKLNSKVAVLLDSTINLKSYLQDQQVKMEGNVDQLQKTIALQSVQKKENESNKKQQEQYLQLTEAQYQQQIKDQQNVQAKAGKIKALLFQIVGVSKAPTFGEALEVAKGAAALVGIRPALLLAVISQESAIGRNVGQCKLTDPQTGSGVKISTGASIIRVMKPTRDVPVFLRLTSDLGRDPYDTPVSCWIPAYVGGQPSGWGGAMGPAQFIPSTWAIFEDRLKSVLGHTANPWAIKDSFTASGMYLADLGATAQTATAEKRAASRYYGGSSSYANSVYNRATCIQNFIDNSTMSDSCERLIF